MDIKPAGLPQWWSLISRGRWRTLFSKELPGIHSLVAGPAQGMGHLGVAAMGYTRWGLYPHCHPSLIFEQEASKPNSWQIAPDLSEALLGGSSSIGAWCDLRGDGYPSFSLPPTVAPFDCLKTERVIWKKQPPNGVDRWRGLWTSLVAADLDGNGHRSASRQLGGQYPVACFTRKTSPMVFWRSS